MDNTDMSRIDENCINRTERHNKVALITWYHYRNYGTALQASALYKVISDMGFETRMVQYRPVGKIHEKMTMALFCKKAYNRILNYLLGPQMYQSNKREKLFADYLKDRIIETDSIITDKDFMELNNVFDAFVCGSDQIWSLLGLNDKYYLSFVKESARKIAYAPSMGVSKIDNPEIERRVAALVREFRYLSVREIQGAKIIKQLTGQDAKVVLDPTLLLTADEWDKFADVSSAKKLQQPYILSYYLGKPSRYRQYVKQVADKWEIPLYEIPTVREHGKYAKFPFEVGPREFVSLIKNAAFVFTDSFHGMAFSINYKIPFAVFERFEKNDPRNQNSRIYSLMELLGIKERLISPKLLMLEENLREYDFSVMEKRMGELKRESMGYLEEALKAATAKVHKPII